MKRSFIFLFCSIIFSKVLYADNNGPSNHYSHKGHMHKEFVKGEEFDINFVKGLEFADAIATLTYFTALIISNNIKTCLNVFN